MSQSRLRLRGQERLYGLKKTGKVMTVRGSKKDPVYPVENVRTLIVSLVKNGINYVFMVTVPVKIVPLPSSF